uniref:Uncharacterized protein n=1 Tax=Strongyloides papillosus TaxID=174720 RepID=A0A0N5BWD3_STREA
MILCHIIVGILKTKSCENFDYCASVKRFFSCKKTKLSLLLLYRLCALEILSNSLQINFLV